MGKFLRINDYGNTLCINRSSSAFVYSMVCSFLLVAPESTGEQLSGISIVAQKVNQYLFFQQSGSIKILDADNNNVIVEKTDIDYENFTLIDLGELNNIPTTSVICEIHIKKLYLGTITFLYGDE